MSSNVMSSNRLPSSRTILLGVVSGIVGGIAFGLMMAAQNMLPMVAMLIGQENPLIGFIVHMAISAFIGATFSLIVLRLPSRLVSLVIAGGLYGVIWWVFGALILMPVMLDMSAMVLQIGEMQIFSLIGHLIFGVLMGATYKIAGERE